MRDTLQKSMALSLMASAVLVGIAGCGGSKSAAPASSSAKQAGATSSPSATPTTKSYATSGASAGSKACSAKAVSARINGSSKCLEVGQQCSHKAVAQYPQYGFECVAKGNLYTLRKKA